MPSANEQFEAIGELYYRRFHCLRPGKSEAPETVRDSMSDENREQFKTWINGPLALYDAIDRIIALDEKVQDLERKLDDADSQ